MKLKSAGIHPSIPDGAKAGTPNCRRKLLTNEAQSSLHFVWNASLEPSIKMIINRFPINYFLPQN